MEACTKTAAPLLIQKDVEERVVNPNLAVIFDEPQFPKAIHKKTHAGPGCAPFGIFSPRDQRPKISLFLTSIERSTYSEHCRDFCRDSYDKLPHLAACQNMRLHEQK